MYPYLLLAFQISRETKCSTALKVEGFSHADLNRFFSMVSSPDENAVELCELAFGTPSYNELDEMFDKEFNQAA